MIKSINNKLVKELNSLKIKKYRDKLELFIIEGERFVDEIPESWGTVQFIVSESFTNGASFKKYSSKEVTILSDNVFNHISDTTTPQGILAVCSIKRPSFTEIIKKENPFILICEKVSDPGNLGTLIRTADAAGCDGIILSKGCADIFSPKVLRATAGSIFHLPVMDNANLRQTVSALKEHRINVIASHLKGEVEPYNLDLKQGCAILIGNEANGLSEEALADSDYLIKIPIRGKAESLNASIAGAILLYEVVRQQQML